MDNTPWGRKESDTTEQLTHESTGEDSGCGLTGKLCASVTLPIRWDESYSSCLAELWEDSMN